MQYAREGEFAAEGQLESAPADLTKCRELIASLVAKVWPGAVLCSLRRLTGGASQQTWAMEIERGPCSGKYILRHAPDDLAHRGFVAGFHCEAAAITAAAARGVPVPTIHHVLTPDDELGEGFVCSLVEGETIARKIQRDQGFAGARQRITRQFGDIAAQIHAIETDGLPLMTFRPGERLNALRALLESDPAPRPVFELAYRWLQHALPESPFQPCVVHGDFRLGNVIVDHSGIVAVLDWEQTHFGDPMEDLAFLMLPPWRFGNMAKPVGGIGRREDLFAAYEARIGAPVAIERVTWWSVFGSLRWGNACSRMVGRFRSGTDPSVERAMIARRASESEFDILESIILEQVSRAEATHV